MICRYKSDKGDFMQVLGISAYLLSSVNLKSINIFITPICKRFERIRLSSFTSDRRGPIYFTSRRDSWGAYSGAC